MKAKRFLSSIALTCLMAEGAMAGGLFTNNNQSPVFFRQPAQNAVIGVQGAYYDPAGLVFMSEGWHLGIGDQMAIQRREITSSYAPLAMNVDAFGSAERKYKGTTFAPVIPNLDLAYTKSKWAASLHLGVVSGGGTCEFKHGLGSFDAPMALLPAAVNSLAPTNIFTRYTADIHFKGESMGLGGQLNFSYKVLDRDNSKLSIAAGVRFNYLRNKYTGGIFDYMLETGGYMIPAESALFGALNTGMHLSAPVAQTIASTLAADKEVSCTQTAFAVNPIVSVHYATGAWDFAVRYEFITKVELKNKTDINTTGLAQFEDGVTSHSDVPALLSAGFNVDILDNLRGAAGMNLYFDKSADYGNDREDKLGRNTLEFDLGLEYDINDKWTVSLGSQITSFDFGENNSYLTDMSYSLSSWCLGGGFRYWFTDRLAIDASIFNTFYSRATKEYADYGGAGATYQQALSQIGFQEGQLSGLIIPGSDRFYRTSLSFGLGIVWDF